VIYIKHASFQLYHCTFPQKYLHALYENGKPDNEDQVVLNRTKFYNFAESEERGEWFDVFVALIRYLVSGESKAGFLNKHHPANLLNKVRTLRVKTNNRILIPKSLRLRQRMYLSKEVVRYSRHRMSEVRRAADEIFEAGVLESARVFKVALVGVRKEWAWETPQKNRQKTLRNVSVAEPFDLKRMHIMYLVYS